MNLKAFANPQAIIEHIEETSTGRPPEDLYRARIEDIMGLLLPRNGNVDQVADAQHLREMGARLVLETAARQTEPGRG